MEPPGPPRNRAVVVSALGITQIISWGAIFYGISVLAKPMAAELGWSLTFIFAGFSVSLLVAGIVSQPVARFIDKRGGRLTLTLGSLAGGIGLGLMSQVNDPIVYISAWILLGLASRLTLYDAAFATLVEIYGHGARRPISVLTLFGGLASTIFWPICHYANEAIGWRGAWLVCALAVLFICTPQRGSFVAGRTVIANLVRSTMNLPRTFSGLTADLARNADASVSPFVPTAVDNMSPRSPFIHGIQGIPVAASVKAHSIIAVEGDGPVEEGDDGVVQYSSAHIEPVESELVVKSSHSTQGNPHTIEEVRRILRLHAGLEPLRR